MTQITDHLAKTERRVASSLTHAGRASDAVTIVAVSKQHSAEAIAEAYAAGQRHFGENYLQEALPKMDRLAGLDIVWHFIGRIQSNKTRPIAERFDWVHTIDRERIAHRLDAQRPADAAPLDVLIEVNLAGEAQKAGIAANDVAALADAIAALPRLRLRGLMTMPPAASSPAESRLQFDALRELAAELRPRHPTIDTLSMGMSNDFEIAIECGATMVRIGTAIFGPRG